ncbi:hypothetical protein BV25DRAFT_1776931, partial [Artomyces pyxidatus]
LLYLGAAEITEHDIPHRTKVTELIFEHFCKQYQKMVSEMQNSEGRISFTTDIWTDPWYAPYMAITAHYLSKNE